LVIYFQREQKYQMSSRLRAQTNVSGSGGRFTFIGMTTTDAPQDLVFAGPYGRISNHVWVYLSLRNCRDNWQAILRDEIPNYAILATTPHCMKQYPLWDELEMPVHQSWKISRPR